MMSRNEISRHSGGGSSASTSLQSSSPDFELIMSLEPASKPFKGDYILMGCPDWPHLAITSSNGVTCDIAVPPDNKHLELLNDGSKRVLLYTKDLHRILIELGDTKRENAIHTDNNKLFMNFFRAVFEADAKHPISIEQIRSGCPPNEPFDLTECMTIPKHGRRQLISDTVTIQEGNSNETQNHHQTTVDSLIDQLKKCKTQIKQLETKHDAELKERDKQVELLRATTTEAAEKMSKVTDQMSKAADKLSKAYVNKQLSNAEAKAARYKKLYTEEKKRGQDAEKAEQAKLDAKDKELTAMKKAKKNKYMKERNQLDKLSSLCVKVMSEKYDQNIAITEQLDEQHKLNSDLNEQIIVKQCRIKGLVKQQLKEEVTMNNLTQVCSEKKLLEELLAAKNKQLEDMTDQLNAMKTLSPESNLQMPGSEGQQLEKGSKVADQIGNSAKPELFKHSGSKQKANKYPVQTSHKQLLANSKPMAPHSDFKMNKGHEMTKASWNLQSPLRKRARLNTKPVSPPRSNLPKPEGIKSKPGCHVNDVLVETQASGNCHSDYAAEGVHEGGCSFDVQEEPIGQTDKTPNFDNLIDGFLYVGYTHSYKSSSVLP